MRAIAAVMSLVAGACAWDAGEPFATLSPRLDAAAVIPADRVLGGGWQRLASSYELRIDRLELDAGALSLIDLGGSLAFDPASPPPGYGLCHNGHCHAADGRLVSYEDIAAELGQGGGAASVVSLPVGAMNLIEGVSRPLACEPSCDLPRADIRQVSLDVRRVVAAGLVRDSGASPRVPGELAWSLELPLAEDAPVILSSAIDLPADRSHAPDVALTLELAISGALFDAVSWSALDGEPLDVAASEDARAAVLEALGELVLQPTVTR